MKQRNFRTLMYSIVINDTHFDVLGIGARRLHRVLCVFVITTNNLHVCTVHQ